ncbi:WD domain, G-beta repeat domain containing protein, putative [Eimeria brunetti]|uniref:WD domain, G-beta repeat domain containing protein, putative n=1 Tax=Eimeria brunetti TaxID=51314 RepID=U6LBB1_9EIME|nr:WD domain, G-beta repeat domain containing protein, putative [Eimeria brunetti]
MAPRNHPVLHFVRRKAEAAAGDPHQRRRARCLDCDAGKLGFRVELPVGPFDDQQTNEYKERGDYEGFHYGLSSYKLKVIKRLPHPKESNCARYMWQRPSIIASCAVDGRVLLYDLDAPGICEGPEVSLVGNRGEVTCLSWNPHREGQLVSCASEGSWVLYDAAAALQQKGNTPGSLKHEGAASFNSCAWTEGDAFVLAQEDGVVSLWDIREPPTKPLGTVTCKGGAANCVATTPLKPEVFTCGSDDGSLGVYDRRRLGPALHAVEGFAALGLSSISFSFFSPSLLLAASKDKYISLLDLEKAGQDQDPEDAEDGPPELLFTHGGHRADIYDACWNCEEKFPQMVASVANDNRLHIWQPKGSVFFDSDSEEEEDPDQLE